LRPRDLIGRRMGEIIDLQVKLQRTERNLITAKPWEFRRGDWEASTFVQMLRPLSVKFEREREELQKKGAKGAAGIPPHIRLEGGTAYTIRALFAHRKEEKMMREIYYLAGLLDCMINQVNPILRTDLLRDMYKKVFAKKEELKVNWFGPLEHVLLPIDPCLHSEQKYRSSLACAPTMKELYRAIRTGTDEMFDILSSEYVFYCPGPRG
jgi:hypothetical protein